MFVSHGNFVIASVIPVILCAPKYLSGEMRRAFGYEGCPIVLVGRAREKTIEPVRKFNPGRHPIKTAKPDRHRRLRRAK